MHGTTIRVEIYLLKFEIAEFAKDCTFAKVVLFIILRQAGQLIRLNSEAPLFRGKICRYFVKTSIKLQYPLQGGGS
jgi:hypothetical protein